MTTSQAQIDAGQAAFTSYNLPLYDFFILDLVCRFAWRCDTAKVMAFYRQHLSANHLEVGVGTGYFLDHSVFPSANPRLGLLDLNPHCLQHAAERLARYAPEIHRGNILEPLAVDARRFDTVGLNYVLHCLPGSLPGKGIAFKHLSALLNPGGKLFGATVLHGGVQHNFLAKHLMQQLNKRRLFSNQQDGLDGLVLALEQQLTNVQVETHGSVALFSGTFSAH